MSCILLHNFIRTEMTVDPIEEQVPTGSNSQESNTEYVDTVEASQQ